MGVFVSGSKYQKVAMKTNFIHDSWMNIGIIRLNQLSFNSSLILTEQLWNYSKTDKPFSSPQQPFQNSANKHPKTCMHVCVHYILTKQKYFCTNKPPSLMRIMRSYRESHQPASHGSRPPTWSCWDRNLSVHQAVQVPSEYITHQYIAMGFFFAHL